MEVSRSVLSVKGWLPWYISYQAGELRVVCVDFIIHVWYTSRREWLPKNCGVAPWIVSETPSNRTSVWESPSFLAFCKSSHIFMANSGSLKFSPKCTNPGLASGGRRSRINRIALNVLHMYLLILRKHSSRGTPPQCSYSLFASPQFSIIDTHRSFVVSSVFKLTIFICVTPTTWRMAPTVW